MEILHCTAEYDKVYYIEYEGALRECELIATESGCGTPVDGYGVDKDSVAVSMRRKVGMQVKRNVKKLILSTL